MMRNIEPGKHKYFLTSIKVIVVFTVFTGLLYTALITFIAQVFFKDKADGSLVVIDGKVVGSKLIGQNFTDEKYFQPRPSAIGYNPTPSGGSNLGPTSKILEQQVLERKEKFFKENYLPSDKSIPVEMLFTSASGVDPHISPAAALLQVDRICRVRKFNEFQKKKLINLIVNKIELPQFGILGEERINVLLLNIELDNLL